MLIIVKRALSEPEQQIIQFQQKKPQQIWDSERSVRLCLNPLGLEVS